MCLHTPSVTGDRHRLVNETCKQRQRTLYKKILSVHILQVHPHTKIGLYTCSPHLRGPLVVSVPFWRVWWASVHYKSLRSWLLLSPRAQRYLTFRFGVPRAVSCTWTKRQWKLFHSPYQHSPAPSQVSPCLSWILNFCSQTLLRRHCLIGWLVNSSSSEISEEYGSHRACLSTLSLDRIAGWWSIPYGSHRSCLSTLSLDTVEDVMVGEVDELEEDVGWSISCLEGVMDVEEGKLEGGVVDKPGTIIATCFTCNRRRSLLVEQIHDKFPKYFSKQFWWA